MTVEDIEKLIAGDEGEEVEVKESTGQRVEACRTPVDGAHTAIVCHVEKGNCAPYVYDGRPYKRVQSSTTVMPQEEYERMLSERGGFRSDWETQVNPGLTLDEIDGCVRLTFTRSAQLSQNTVQLSQKSCPETQEVSQKLGKKSGQEKQKVSQKRGQEVSQKRSKVSQKTAREVSQKADRSIENVLPMLRRDVRKNTLHVLCAIGLNTRVTIREIARQTGVSVATVKNAEALLKEVGILFRIGGDRGGHWMISWKDT